MHDAIEKYKIIRFDSSLRDWDIFFEPNGSMPLDFCPWCGAKLPAPLNSVIYKVLKREYSIENPDIWNFTNVPDEFRSDAWWKKLGEKKINEYLAEVELERGKEKVEMTGDLSMAPALPTNGQETLKESIEYNRADPNCYGRIGVDPSTGEIVYFEWSREPSNAFSGYIVNWQDLPSDPEKYRGARQALINYGIVSGKTGRIEPKLRWSYK